MDTSRYYPALGKTVWGLNGFVVLIAVFLVTGSSRITIEFGLLMGLGLAYIQLMHIDTMYGREIERLKQQIEDQGSGGKMR